MKKEMTLEDVHAIWDSVTEKDISNLIGKIGIPIYDSLKSHEVPAELQTYVDNAVIGECYGIALDILSEKGFDYDKYNYVVSYPIAYIKKTEEYHFLWRHGVIMVDQKYIFDPIYLKHYATDPYFEIVGYKCLIFQNDFIRQYMKYPFMRDTDDLVKFAVKTKNRRCLEQMLLLKGL